MTQAFTQPVVSAFAALPAPVVESTGFLPRSATVPRPASTSLDKVPIGRA
jgi:hypothetical protein